MKITEDENAAAGVVSSHEVPTERLEEQDGDCPSIDSQTAAHQAAANPLGLQCGGHDGAATRSTNEEDVKERHWKESVFAVGLVDLTWQTKQRSTHSSTRRTTMADNLGCLCSCLGAGRVGNMVILKEGKTSEGKRRLDVVMGPYWPCAIMITFPLIVGLSLLILFQVILDANLILQVVWASLTVGLMVSLVLVSCRNPGILYRHAIISSPTSNWLWNDQALTFRPKTSKYDTECAAVIEEFDHTCPWTGTAIGKNNMAAFRAFCVLVLVCIVFDVILLMSQRFF